MIQQVSWAERGRELGAAFDAYGAVVFVGAEADAVAQVALGVARVQARTRRVAVGDLFGETPRLEALVYDEDPHGLVDSFLYGVSLNRIAHPVAGAGELFVMRSGTGPLDYEELLPHPRWARLAAGFREVGALLVLIAPAGAPRLQELVDALDGAVIVGETAPPDVLVAHSIAWLRARAAPPPPAESDAVAPVEDALAPPPAGGSPANPAGHAPGGGRNRRALPGTIAGLAASAAIALLAVWFWQRPFAADGRSGIGVRPDSPPARRATAGALVADSVARRRADSLRRDSLVSLTGAAALPDSFPVLPPANAGDSAAASAFAVRLEKTNTKSGAILDLRGKFDGVPASTYGFELGTRFYLLYAGAYPTRAGADSLLQQLRARRLLAPTMGSIASVPLAFLVQMDVPLAEVPARLARFAARGQPVYALQQANGAAHLFFGAFESPQQAALAVPAVRDAGLTPTLVYRIGRVF